MAQVHSKYLRYKIGHNLKARHKGNKLTGQGERGNKRDKKVEKCKMRTKGGNKWGGVQIGKKRGLRKGRRLMSRLFPADPRAEFTSSAGLRGGSCRLTAKQVHTSAKQSSGIQRSAWSTAALCRLTTDCSEVCSLHCTSTLCSSALNANVS